MKIHPVVHINSLEMAVEQSSRALDAGADGVFLIDHHLTSPLLTFETLAATRERNPGAHIGINLLGHKTLQILNFIDAAIAEGRIDRAPDALWVDDVLQPNRSDAEVSFIAQQQQPALRAMRLFGGIAFKYTASYTDDPEIAARQTEQLDDVVDVVTTSGKGTGYAPSPSKLAAMRAATAKPIAVASGISADNVADYSGSVDEVLIASSIETEPYSGVFDEAELMRAIKAIHAA